MRRSLSRRRSHARRCGATFSSSSLRFSAFAMAPVTSSARRLREVSIVQLRTQTGKPQLALLRLNAPFTGKRAPFGSSCAAARKWPVSRPLSSSSALSTLMDIDAVSSAPDAYRKAARRKRQILQQEIRQITLAHRHHERELRLLLLLGHGLDRFGAVRRRFALRPSDQHLPSISRHSSRQTPRMMVYRALFSSPMFLPPSG